MVTRRITLRDETLPHQIIIDFGGVSCNCQCSRDSLGRRDKNPERRNPKPFAPFGSLDEMWAAYNDPSNHRGELP
jgi:hypothetical protein